jgi:Mrp family chromosome partitioning ATPase
MTEHSKIDRDKAKQASLLERADAAFGLSGFGTSAVPNDLPAPRRPTRSVSTPATPDTPDAADESMVAEPAIKVETEKAVTFSGPQLEIDREVLRREGLIVPEDGATGLLEEFRIVKREVLAEARAAGDAIARRVLVCSPHSGEGKTYCAMNLAIALASERDIEVVLVDADMPKPTVASRLGVEGGLGLMDALADRELAIEDLVSPTDIEGLFILPAGSSGSRDADLLTGAYTRQLLDRLTRDAPGRILVFDTPPALAASPAAELAAHVGQALLVVRADETSSAAFDDARQLLGACPDIKLLLNAVQFSPSGRRFGDYGDRVV